MVCKTQTETGPASAQARDRLGLSDAVDLVWLTYLYVVHIVRGDLVSLLSTFVFDLVSVLSLL